MAEFPLEKIIVGGDTYKIASGGGGLKKAKFNNNGTINWIDTPPQSFQEEPQLYRIERADGANNNAFDLDGIYATCGNLPVKTWPLKCDMLVLVSTPTYFDIVTCPKSKTEYSGSNIPGPSDIVKYLRSIGPVAGYISMPSYTDFVQCYDEDDALIPHNDQGFVYIYNDGTFIIYYGSDQYEYKSISKIEIANNLQEYGINLGRLRLDAKLCIKSRTGYSDTFNEYSMLNCTACDSSVNTFEPVSPNRLQSGVTLIIGHWYIF